MKTLIFGSAGQLGNALLEAAPSDAEVVAVTRQDGDLSIAGVAGDIISKNCPTLILNAAAYKSVDGAELNHAHARALNELAPAEMAQAASQTGARFIHVSTDFVFDGAARKPYQPEDQTSPLGMYGQTKRDGEQAVLRADPTAMIVRVGWLYGADGQNFVKSMLRLAEKQDTLAVVSDQIGTPTSARSTAVALWALAQTDVFGLMHYSDRGEASWYDFAVAIFEEAVTVGLLDQAPTVRPIASIDYPTAAKRPPYSVLDPTASAAILGSSPQHWRTHLRKVIEELKHRG